MQELERLEKGEYKDAGLQKLKLGSHLSTFPLQILDLAPTLEILDLSGTGLSSLPAEIRQLQRLKIAFFSACRFETFPKELAECPQLEMVAFRGNQMKHIPENALPPHLRWLILTDNQIESLPASIGKCHRLEKCMLSGNRLQSLPDEMANCHNLGLLRLSANQISTPPSWLFTLPSLAFLALAGNPCCSASEVLSSDTPLQGQEQIHWNDLSIQETLGEGASGIISKATWKNKSVAVKLFRGGVTSDGTPMDELAACVVAGKHPNLIDSLGRIRDHPSSEGLVMQLIPPTFKTLGQPPSMQSCTRDTYAGAPALSEEHCMRVAAGIASVGEHLHAHGVAHGDIYAHNILVDEAGQAILGDFGAASVYGPSNSITAVDKVRFQKLEVRALGYLIEDLLGLHKGSFTASLDKLKALGSRCTSTNVDDRPSFAEVCSDLEAL